MVKLLDEAHRSGKNFLELVYLSGYELHTLMYCEYESDKKIQWSPSYVNGRSITDGKRITDYKIHKDTLEAHILPNNKKAKKRLQKELSQINKSADIPLSEEEYLVLSNPYIYPHPTLMVQLGADPYDKNSIKRFIREKTFKKFYPVKTKV